MRDRGHDEERGAVPQNRSDVDVARFVNDLRLVVIAVMPF